jgi:hypothetical protein
MVRVIFLWMNGVYIYMFVIAHQTEFHMTISVLATIYCHFAVM